MKQYDTVIFDLDGTLMDTLEDLADAVNEILQRNGYPVRTIQEVRRIVGNGLRQTLTLCLPQGTGEEVIDKLLPEFASYYQEHCQIRTKPYDGIMETLRELYERGFKLAIVSNKRDEAVKTLNREYFQEYIRVAIGEMKARGSGRNRRRIRSIRHCGSSAAKRSRQSMWGIRRWTGRRRKTRDCPVFPWTGAFVTGRNWKN